MGVRIVTDSAADLSKSICERLKIGIASLIVTSEGESYEDTALDKARFWQMAESEQGVGTSQPPTGAFRRMFQRIIDEGHEVVCLTVTSKHSGTYNSAWTAARDFGDKVSIFDTLSLSLAQGWQAVRAAEMAAAGKTRDDILAMLNSLVDRTRVLIYLDSTDFLRRGGRASKLMPHIERLVKRLNLHPILDVIEGELKLYGVVRSRKKAITRIAEQIAGLPRIEQLAVAHIRAEEAAQQLAAELSRLTGVARDAIQIGEAGVVLASHAGKGVVAAMAVTSP